ncbi:hypothetical protein CUMW_139040 [Citrus unshiu]|uniref:Ubiquitin-like protease family profile domain-containing protein n=1 Tax=Citrus unshiu TaxID=55188 RepID=A0A2H5PI71_CITUN|nr:hypothetical protein CUMW_139040 [Citrus unshiu]
MFHIITMYADYKNMKEAEKDVTSPRCWFLPTYYSQAALADWSSLNFAQAAGFRDRYMGRLDTCEKLASLDFVLRQEARALFAGVPQQPNGFDCGYYVMKYMDNLSIVVHDSYQHDSDHARLLLALYLVQSPLNKIRRRLIQEARKL